MNINKTINKDYAFTAVAGALLKIPGKSIHVWWKLKAVANLFSYTI